MKNKKIEFIIFAVVIFIVGIFICDKKNYSNVIVTFSIEDARLESIMANLVWHNPQSDYETLTSWVYPLNANWQIECMGLDKVR